MTSAACDKSNGGIVIRVDSPNVQYTRDYIESTLEYPINYAINRNNAIVVNINICDIKLQVYNMFYIFYNILYLHR